MAEVGIQLIIWKKIQFSHCQRLRSKHEGDIKFMVTNFTLLPVTAQRSMNCKNLNKKKDVEYFLTFYIHVSINEGTPVFIF